MSLKEHREAKSDALVSMSRLLAKDKEEFYAYLNTAEGKEMYKLAMSEVVAEIEIFVSLGKFLLNLTRGIICLMNTMKKIGKKSARSYRPI